MIVLYKIFWEIIPTVSLEKNSILHTYLLQVYIKWEKQYISLMALTNFSIQHQEG